MSTGSRVIAAMLLVAAAAVAFWVLLLSPKQGEVSKLDGQVNQLKATLANHRAEVKEGIEAREGFPSAYQQLVVLGKAVPNDSDTASLLVQLKRISERAGVRFQEVQLNSSGGGAAPPAPESSPSAGSATGTGSSPVPATEMAASLLPLGAAIGPAGLAVMPYTLTFTGNFFHIADFIQGLDALVKTTNTRVAVDGRLITVDGFSLAPGPNGFPNLQASFSVTTYLTPPGQGLTGGATPAGPGSSTATPAATTLGGSP